VTSRPRTNAPGFLHAALEEAFARAEADSVTASDEAGLVERLAKKSTSSSAPSGTLKSPSLRSRFGKILSSARATYLNFDTLQKTHRSGKASLHWGFLCALREHKQAVSAEDFLVGIQAANSSLLSSSDLQKDWIFRHSMLPISNPFTKKCRS